MTTHRCGTALRASVPADHDGTTVDSHPSYCPRCLVVTADPLPLTAQDHADIMARATGSSSATYRVEQRNADGTLTVLETATSTPREK